LYDHQLIWQFKNFKSWITKILCHLTSICVKSKKNDHCAYIQERLRSGGSPYAKLKLNRAEESHVLHGLHGLKRKPACYHTVETKEGGVGTGNIQCMWIAWIACNIACCIAWIACIACISTFFSSLGYLQFLF